MGQHNFYDTAEENPARQELEVEDWFWHDNLAKDNYYEDDIALIKLKVRNQGRCHVLMIHKV